MSYSQSVTISIVGAVDDHETCTADGGTYTGVCDADLGVSQSFANVFSKFVLWSRNAEIPPKFAHPLCEICLASAH